MKYKLLKEIKGIDWKVGEIKYINIGDCYWVDDLEDSFGYCPLNLALLEHCGFIEEVVEWDASKLRLGDKYWLIDSAGIVINSNWCDISSDMYRQKTGNMFRTREESEAKLKSIMES